MTQAADDQWNISPPPWMDRAQKKHFRQLVRVRREANDPLSESEIDSLGDYVAARRRLAELQKLWERASDDARGEYGVPDEKRVVAISRQMEAVAKLSRRLAQLLRI